MAICTISDTLNFGILWIRDLKKGSNLLKSKFRTLKIAKNDIFGPFEFNKIRFHVKSEWQWNYKISTKLSHNFTFWKFLEHSEMVSLEFYQLQKCFKMFLKIQRQLLWSTMEITKWSRSQINFRGNYTQKYQLQYLLCRKIPKQLWW